MPDHTPLALLASSGSPQIDEIAAGLVELLLLHFPARISGCYFEGSCADGALTPLSDIDLTVVFAGALMPGERERFAGLLGACKRISPRSLDASCVDEAALLGAGRLSFQADWRPVLRATTLKCASLPIWGDDLRPRIPLVPHGVYARTMMHFPFLVLAGQRGHPPRLSCPLDYPDPSDEFFGYAARKLRAADGTPTPSTKRLVHSAGYIATALLAERSPLYLANKRAATAAYRQHIGDGWASHLEEVQRHCRARWGYRVPEPPADRALLRRLCTRQLELENAFMASYREFLAREQDADDDAARLFARERQALI